MNRSVMTGSGNSLDAACEGGETPAMENEKPGPIHLRRIDPSQNMRRFYALAIQPTLFGGASVVRNWGRIGTHSQSMTETFDNTADAVLASRRLERMKRRRGYRDCGQA
jgi:predicted DNA-binding WGR domain protein